MYQLRPSERQWPTREAGYINQNISFQFNDTQTIDAIEIGDVLGKDAGLYDTQSHRYFSKLLSDGDWAEITVTYTKHDDLYTPTFDYVAVPQKLEDSGIHAVAKQSRLAVVDMFGWLSLKGLTEVKPAWTTVEVDFCGTHEATLGEKNMEAHQIFAELAHLHSLEPEDFQDKY